MADIDVLISLSSTGSEQAAFLRKTALALESGKHKIQWICARTDSQATVPDGFIDAGEVDVPESYLAFKKGNSYDRSVPSIIHSLGIKKCLVKSSAPYVCFADSDIAILRKDWDDICVELLDRVDIVGAEYAKSCAYKNFPCLYFCITRRELFDRLNVNVSPLCDSKMKVIQKPISNPRLAEMLGVRQSDFCAETGWQLPVKYKRNGYTGLTLNLHPYTQTIMPFATKEDLAYYQERVKDASMHEYVYEGKLFLTHLKSGRQFRASGSRFSIWKRRIEMYLKETYQIV